MAAELKQAILANDTAKVRTLLEADRALADADMNAVAEPVVAVKGKAPRKPAPAAPAPPPGYVPSKLLPSTFAMKQRCDAKLVGLLLDNSTADINALIPLPPRGKNSGTALFEAVNTNREDYVELLLSKGADPRVKDREDISLVIRPALMNASPAIVAMLVKKAPELFDQINGDKGRPGTQPLLELVNADTNLQIGLGMASGLDKLERLKREFGKPMMDVRVYVHYKSSGTSQDIPVLTTKLPKGTLLFRGIHGLDLMPSDFLGVVNEKGKYCLPHQYMVYFYPFPFVDITVGHYPSYVIYALTDDTEIATFISPATTARADRVNKLVPIQTCSEADLLGCGLEGREYDPCFKRDFMKSHPNIVGLIGIAGQDRASFHRNITDPRGMGAYANTYFGGYMDVLDSTPAVPEIVLYPRKTKGAGDITGTPKFATAAEFMRWLPDHKDTYAYEPYHVFSARHPTFIKDFLDERIADRRIQLDATTGFFVDTALAKDDYRGNLVPAGPGAIGNLDPARLRFTRAPLVAASAPAAPAPAAKGSNAAGGP